jgi:hypothetical protein
MREMESPLCHKTKGRKEPTGLEPFVDAMVASRFLSLRPQRILALARNGDIPGYPIGRGQRKTWRFRLSEIAAQLETLRPQVEDGTTLTDSAHATPPSNTTASAGHQASKPRM